MKQLLFVAILLTTALAAQTQTDTSKKEKGEFTYDTVKTHVLYIANGAGEVKGAFAKRVEKTTMQFSNPTPEEVKAAKETLTLKKQKIMVDYYYLIEQEVITADKKGKQTKTVKEIPFPKEWVVQDTQRTKEILLKTVIDEFNKK